MDNASAWGALGAGLSTLGEGLNAMQLRKLAEEQRKREEARQAEQDALEKAIAQANAAKGLRAENFTLSQKAGVGTNSPDAMKAILNRAAMNKGGEDVTDPISGDTYYRAPGDSPNDQRRTLEEAKLDAARERAALTAANAAEMQRIKGEQASRLRATLSADAQARADAVVKAAKIRAGASGGSGTKGQVTPAQRLEKITLLARQLAAPHYNRETMEEEDGLEWSAAVTQAMTLVDQAEHPSKASSGGNKPSRAATDADIQEAMKAVGNDPTKVRAWLKSRGITE